jgi:hypothetical protein
MSDQFSPFELNLLAGEGEIKIETQSSKSPLQVIIWIVEDRGQLYIRSVHGERGRWYRNIKAQPEAIIHAAGEHIPVKAVAVTDDQEIEHVSQAFRVKYASDPPNVAAMMKSETLPTTLRLLSA